MSSDARLVPLSDVCDINPRHEGELPPTTAVTFVPMSAVDEKSGVITGSEIKLYAEVVRGYTPFKKGDVLFAKITPCMENGKCAIVKEIENGIGFGSTEFHVLRPRKEVIPEWVYYFLRQQEVRDFAARHMTGTAGQQRVPKSIFDRLMIAVPPLSIQEKSIAILARADGAREKRRQANELTEQFLQSAFLEMFGDPVTNPKGWYTTNIGSIASHVSSGSTPLGGESTYLSTGIPFIRSQNVQMNLLDLADVAHISSKVHESMQRTWVKRGDVLLNITGASIGRVAYFDGDDDSANVNQHVCIIRAITSKVLPQFLSFLISTSSFQRTILSHNSGATRQAFNFEQIRGFTVHLPPIEEQQRFAILFEKVRLIRAEQIGSERELENLFNSLMQRAFTGELVS